jgi:hypothetical protein
MNTLNPHEIYRNRKLAAQGGTVQSNAKQGKSAELSTPAPTGYRTSVFWQLADARAHALAAKSA